jgi:2-iminobutanoate/2-iminopropanoate deaminase
MTTIHHDTHVSAHLGSYSDAIEVASPQRWLFTAGTPGMLPDGKMAQGIEAQVRQAWTNVIAALEKSGMGLEHIIKVTTTMAHAEDIPVYAKIRAEILGDLRPALMLQVVTQMIKPDILVEMEIVAAQ